MNNDQRQFYSNGKLLLTGEYVVLDGALSLAVPTTYGQSLTVKEIDLPHLVWKSMDEKGAIWFEGIFELNEKNTPDELRFLFPSPEGYAIAEMLVNILIEAKKLNPEFLNAEKGYEVKTQLSFPINWGLGSSSTLINNIAQWAKVDAFELLWKTFSGSGYDIACAQHNTPILYKLKDSTPIVEEIAFDPSFKDHLYFVHLNKKQNSREGIAEYQKKDFDKANVIHGISEITQEMVLCNDLSHFESLITKHEALLSHALNIPTVKESYFPDYYGCIKSLGAWGGDFILATGKEKTPKYFKEKGYTTIIPYSEMVL